MHGVKKFYSFYNKYKPEKEPVCIDCLTEEAKELNPPNLFLPYSNLEQDYYFQKKSLLQIIDQANNIKKYEKHIINFQQLMIRYFSSPWFIRDLLQCFDSDKIKYKKSRNIRKKIEKQFIHMMELKLLKDPSINSCLYVN